jgi:hypothetical protein
MQDRYRRAADRNVKQPTEIVMQPKGISALVHWQKIKMPSNDGADPGTATHQAREKENIPPQAE